MTRSASFGLALALAVGCLAATSSAEAQSRERRFFAGAGLGVGVLFDGGDAYFRIEENLGYHVLPVAEHPGLYVALTLVQSVGRLTMLDFAGRIGFDIQAWRDADVAVLINPSVQLGVGMWISQGTAYPGFHLHPSLEISLAMLDDMLDVWLRPLGFDVLARDGGGAAYTLMAGLNVNL
jgi:hypothetical protein